MSTKKNTFFILVIVIFSALLFLLSFSSSFPFNSSGDSVSSPLFKTWWLRGFLLLVVVSLIFVISKYINYGVHLSNEALILQAFEWVQIMYLFETHFRIQKADTIILNANVYTQYGKNQINEAIAIKNGRILNTGSEYKMLRYAAEQTEYSDMEGRTIVPQKENSKIKRGKAADFLILETNLFEATGSQLVKSKVQTTIKEGKKI